MTLPTGRERRRTDLYGRTRRFLYGILLLAASPGAHAADQMAEMGKFAAAVRQGVKVNLVVPDVGVLHVNVNHSPEARLEFQKTKGSSDFQPAEATLKYSNNGGFSEEKVPQIAVKWRI